MNVTVDGLVLRSVDYRESDKILTVLTRQKGRLTVKAAGARRKGSRLQSGTQPFCYSQMTLFEKDGRYRLDETSVREQFYGLTGDLDKMALASYFAQVLGLEPEESPGSEEALRLALNSLYALERGLYPPEVVKPAFELRYMAMNGYAPDLSPANGRDGFIDPNDGLLRPADGAPLPGDLFLDARAIDAARYIVSCDLKRLFAFRLPEESLRNLSVFAERYLLCKTEQGFRALDFYHSLRQLP